METCTRCSKLCLSRTRIVLPTPCPPGGLLAIGEAPGAEEDDVGEGFVGRAGKTLTALLAEHGISRSDFGRANIVRCRPTDDAGENRKPTPAETSACLPLLAAHIEATRHRVILCVGQTPTAVFLGAGNLGRRISDSLQSAWCDFSLAHDALRSALEPSGWLRSVGGIHCVPMPHTSPLAWNRNAADGRKWSVVGRGQVAYAVSLLHMLQKE